MLKYGNHNIEIKFVICNVCTSLLINILSNRSNDYHDFTVELDMGDICYNINVIRKYFF